MHVSDKTRKGLFFLALVLVALLIAGYIQLRQFSAEPEMLTGVETPNSFDAKNARRKLALFTNALQSGTSGYISLTEVEINSYLNDRFSPHVAPGSSNAPTWSPLGRCRVNLSTNHITFYTWARKQWLGRTFDFIWERDAQILPAAPSWKLNLTSMRVGQTSIPTSYWPDVRNFFSDADERIAADFQKLLQLPGVEIVPRPYGRKPELRLYTYTRTNTVQVTTPPPSPSPAAPVTTALLPRRSPQTQ